MKRLFALMLALVLCASTLPASAAVQADFAPSEAIIQFIANQEGFRAYAHSSGGRNFCFLVNISTTLTLLPT